MDKFSYLMLSLVVLYPLALLAVRALHLVLVRYG